jgi:hypothetical protein
VYSVTLLGVGIYLTPFTNDMEFSPKCIKFWEAKVFVNPDYVLGMDYDQIWDYLCVDGKHLFPDPSDPTKATMVVTTSSHIDAAPKPKSNEYGVSDRTKMMDMFRFETKSQDVIVLKDGIMSNPKTDVAAYLLAVKELSLVLGTKAVGITMKRPTRKQRNLDITSPRFGVDAKYLEDKVERETRWAVKEVVNGVVVEQNVVQGSKSASSRKPKSAGASHDQVEAF